MKLPIESRLDDALALIAKLVDGLQNLERRVGEQGATQAALVRDVGKFQHDIRSNAGKAANLDTRLRDLEAEHINSRLVKLEANGSGK